MNGIRNYQKGVLKMDGFYPEGSLINTESNKRSIGSFAGLTEAALGEFILEARAVLCDALHSIHVDMPCMEGVIPYYEGALGIAEGFTRDIALISRVGKPVCFVVKGFEDIEGGRKRAILSRREAQEKCKLYYINQLRCGDIIPAKVTRLESFGAFCDIGCGLPALMPIASLSVSRISHPNDRLYPGMDILGVVSSTLDDRVCLSQRELLGTWQQNAALFSQGETVAGIVRSVEDYGIFVELTPNLAGLAEPREGVLPGQCAAVYIKSILPTKMKLKLVIIDTSPPSFEHAPLKYFINEGHIDCWQYSPPGCDKVIQTVFA